jgi:hypothetical protein
MKLQHIPETSPPMKRHAGIRGIRIWCHKPGRLGTTTINVPAKQYAALLALAGDEKTLTNAAREVSWRYPEATPGVAWSHTVIAHIFKRLRALKAGERQQDEARAAAENNAYWSQLVSAVEE